MNQDTQAKRTPKFIKAHKNTLASASASFLVSNKQKVTPSVPTPYKQKDTYDKLKPPPSLVRKKIHRSIESHKSAGANLNHTPNSFARMSSKVAP